MLSRAVIRSVSTLRFAEFRVQPTCLRKNFSRRWRRPLTSTNHPNNNQKKSSELESVSYETTNKESKVNESFNDDHTSREILEKPFLDLNSNSITNGQPSTKSTDGNTRSTEKIEISSRKDDLDSNDSLENYPISFNSKPLSTSDLVTQEKYSSNYSLPDLTQGIPSSQDYDARKKHTSSDLNLLHLKGTFQNGGYRDRGSLPASAYISSSEKKRLQVANYFYGAFFLFSIFGTLYLGRNWGTEEEENEHSQAPSGWSIGLMWKRAKARIGDELNYYQAPAFRKLLPDVDPMFERPYTLVLSLEDLLICSEWTREQGWRLAKRPGVDYFLRYLSQYYELVVFTTQPSHLAEPIIRKLDPYHIIMWPLFREATLYENGEYTKDLSFLNRDPSKVIILDTDKAHVKKQPENAIILEPWRGDPNDKELVSLIPFLEYIPTMAYSDVRKALKSFEGKYIPTEFARREAIARKKFHEQLEEEKKRRPKRSLLGLLGDSLGIKYQPMMFDPNEQSPAEAFAQGKMLQDQARERGQRNYQILEKEIRENGEKWLKEEAALEEKSKEESMKALKSGITGFFGFGQDTESEPKSIK
ncbi:Mitochondrial import inner membrane translocase subunit tim50 [Erysiphe neolycopersici]|uniref:Mitochondrial import inner membrane translocase subunit TIM50 n=1 Tax=Erysiphe neolycopersici TaxID=212602 RepID=A0A420HVG9_9PEZI|nr:Mitochondrial import inner membrane translocase subunit tim50 [Erysiphe neolycopersici]